MLSMLLGLPCTVLAQECDKDVVLKHLDSDAPALQVGGLLLTLKCCAAVSLRCPGLTLA
jgi:hypothetical protein